MSVLHDRRLERDEATRIDVELDVDAERQRAILDVGLGGLVAGVVFGTMAACRSASGLTALDVVRATFADAPFPVGFGLPSGHDPAETPVENLVLPLGVDVELAVDAGRLVALEPAVV